MERTISMIIFTLFAVIAASMLLTFVKKNLGPIHPEKIDQIGNERGLFTSQPCNPSDCRSTDTNTTDCLVPACFPEGCVADAANATPGASCTLPDGSAGNCVGASCIQ